jgi:hypothetical protein
MHHANRALSPCLINSLPKSGTHLVRKIVGMLPGMVHAGIGFARPAGVQGSGIPTSGTSVPLGVNSPFWIGLNEFRERLQQLGPGTYATGHLPFAPETVRLLDQNGIKMVLILRDPRDVAVSLTHHILTVGEPTLRSHYLSLSPAERLMTSLTGWRDDSAAVGFLGIRERLESVLPWAHLATTYSTTFERLVGPEGGGTRESQTYEIRAIGEHLGFLWTNGNLDQIAERSFGGTGTFRSGRIGSWKQDYGLEHKEYCKEMIGDHLIALGYERDLSW